MPSFMIALYIAHIRVHIHVQEVIQNSHDLAADSSVWTNLLQA